MDKENLNNILMNEDMNEIIIEKSNTYKFENSNYNNRKFIVKKNCQVNIIELNCISKKTDYFLEENTKLIINKFYDENEIKEEINVYLNGINSRLILNISTISSKNQMYKINIFHNNKDTISETIVHAVSKLDNKIEIENNGYIKSGCKNSVLYQDNKIITLKENNSIIKPNLYIDEFDSEASHGAFVGKFSEEVMFYLKSRGLNEKESFNLLIIGFLINNLNLDSNIFKLLEKRISKYWR